VGDDSHVALIKNFQVRKEVWVVHCQRQSFPRFSQNLLPFLCRIHCEIASGQINDPKYMDVTISISIKLREILYTDSQDMLVLSSTIASLFLSHSLQFIFSL
jgi:hypothetical protein